MLYYVILCYYSILYYITLYYITLHYIIFIIIILYYIFVISYYKNGNNFILILIYVFKQKGNDCRNKTLRGLLVYLCELPLILGEEKTKKK